MTAVKRGEDESAGHGSSGSERTMHLVSQRRLRNRPRFLEFMRLVDHRKECSKDRWVIEHAVES